MVAWLRSSNPGSFAMFTAVRRAASRVQRRVFQSPVTAAAHTIPLADGLSGPDDECEHSDTNDQSHLRQRGLMVREMHTVRIVVRVVRFAHLKMVTRPKFRSLTLEQCSRCVSELSNKSSGVSKKQRVARTPWLLPFCIRSNLKPPTFSLAFYLTIHGSALVIDDAAELLVTKRGSLTNARALGRSCCWSRLHPRLASAGRREEMCERSARGNAYRGSRSRRSEMSAQLLQRQQSRQHSGDG
jgi:hypothetical protein